MIETIMEDRIGVEGPIEKGRGEPSAHEAQILVFDRRRTGRQKVSPVLVPLLRDPAHAALGLAQSADAGTPYRDYLTADPFYDRLAPARGIAIGLTISMLFWGVVGYTIFR